MRSKLVDEIYPRADSIVLVLDNLNTDKKASAKKIGSGKKHTLSDTFEGICVQKDCYQYIA